MITLGINYLGGPGHDSSAALAVDGKIVYAIAEERLSRNKQDSNFPILAIQACLNHANINIEEVDDLVFGWPKLKEHFLENIKLNFKRDLKESFPLQFFNYYRSSTIRSVKNIMEEHQLFPKKTTHIDHHLAHALSVMPYLKSENALIFVVDGRGIKESTTVYLKKDQSLEEIKRINFPNSLGVYYAEMTSLCGFRKYADEWKVMGLAPYGKEIYDLDDYLKVENGFHQVNHRKLLNADQIELNGRTLQKRKSDIDSINDEEVKNLAFSAQHYYEMAILELMRYYTDLYNLKAVGLAGGVGLNCKANGFVQRELALEEFFIQPAATDDGTALGAALYPFYQNKSIQTMTFDPYLGNSYSDSEIASILEKYKLKFEKLPDVEKDAAQELANGKILGWFQGRDEFGPRALGNRSILSDPRDEKMRDRVNEIVKYREGWRPFAPSILAEKASEVLANIEYSPYMILTDSATEAYESKIPAVVHVDKTLRPQTVHKSLNPRYWNLINEFYQLTGVPVVVNTSFNLKGEPNVSHPSDAIKTFFTSGLDLLYLGNFKVYKTFN
ncbi:MAG: carbamoyltransferase C-terminal domain-containing protein [Cyclobacterium sp.]|uniref:carbamoyltransferase family protein n=1 Tax=unclassified Cyclobacterium TaxID=2615055 RepID=UPI0013D6B3B6|nr:carbamoyltransferase C-terminal domain-containing protein [Cyclobacterium sp. SYSU L10401]